MSAMRTRPQVSGCFLLSAICLSSVAFSQMRWERTYGWPYYPDYGSSVRQTADGGYIIAGVTTSFIPRGPDVWLTKTDSQGETLWTRIYGGSETDFGWSVQQTADGGYIIAGATALAGSFDVYLLKTDANGDTLWTSTYGGASGDVGYSVQPTADGGYVISGSTESSGAGGQDVWLIKTDPQGRVVP